MPRTQALLYLALNLGPAVAIMGCAQQSSTTDFNGRYKNCSEADPPRGPSLWILLNKQSREAMASGDADVYGGIVDRISASADIVDVRASGDGTVTSTLIRGGRVLATQTIAFHSAGDCNHFSFNYGGSAKLTPLPFLWATSDNHDDVAPFGMNNSKGLEFSRGWSARMWLGVIPLESSGFTWHYRFARAVSTATGPVLPAFRCVVCPRCKIRNEPLNQ